MVASEPGEWFERTLESLADVEYDNFAVLVLDNASEAGLAERIAPVLPSAFVKTLEPNQGFSGAANQVLTSVEGASFYLFLHDDVELCPGAVTELVAEAFRANAGIVGPKLVDWNEPRRLRSVGVRVDPFGFSSSISEPGELDQAQHDTARPLFAVSGAAMLVRADLFEELGGFDPDIPFFGEAVDLCWRAHLAGASVAFAPKAVVAHRGSFEEREPEINRRRLEVRHETRTMLRNYSLRRLLWLVPVAVALSLVDLTGSLLLGRFDRSGDIASAWLWNLANLPSLIRSRRRVAGIRRVPDRAYTALMRQGSSRLGGLVRAGDGENALRTLASSGRGFIREARSRSARGGAVLLIAVIVLLGYGSRDLFTGVLPSLREIPSLGPAGGRLISEWFDGWRDVGLGVASPSPPGVPMAGLLAWVLFGSAGAARRLLVLGPVVVGAVGAWKLLGRRASTAARSTVLAAYSLSPVLLGALGSGRFSAMVTFAIAPWVLRIVARDSGVAPFATVPGATHGRGPSRVSPRSRPPIDERTGAGHRSSTVDDGYVSGARDPWRSSAVVALLLALVGSFTLLGALVLVDVLVVCAIVAAVSIDRRGGLRMLRLTAVGGLGAALLMVPWLYALVRHGDLSAFTGLYPTMVRAPSVPRIITGSVGSVRSGSLGWGLVAAGVFPLLVARGWRIAWAVAAWVVVLSSWLSAVLVAGAGHFGGSGLELLLVPAALGMAVALGMGVLAFEEDVLGFDFGVQQILAGVALVVGVVGLVPVVVASTDGRWFQPRGDFDTALEPLDASGGFRTLWIGDPDVLPVAGWMIADSDLAAGTSAGLEPTLDERYRSGGDAGMDMLTEALRVAIDGQTSRLGRILGPMGIRYVVVVDRASPAPFGSQQVPMPGRVVAALQSQLDLVSIDVNPAMATFRVEDAWPLRGSLAMETDTDLFSAGSVDDSLRAQLWAQPSVPEAVLGRGFGTGFRGEVPEGTMIAQAVGADPGWRMTVGGRPAERLDHRGWAQVFDPTTSASSATGSDADLSWGPPPGFRGLQALQLLALVGLVSLVALRGRGRLRISRPRDGSGSEGALVLMGDEGPIPAARTLHERSGPPGSSVEESGDGESGSDE